MKLTTSTFDLSGMSLSAACLVHCLALPAAAAFFPVFATLAHAEWVHWVILAVAFPISTIVTRAAMMRGSALVPCLLACGLILLAVGATHVAADAWEVPITLAGGCLLAAGHLINMRAGWHFRRRA